MICFLLFFLGNRAYANKGKLIKNTFKIDNKLGNSSSAKFKTNYYKTSKIILRQPHIIISKDTGVISSCVGFASVNPNLQQFNVSGTGLSQNINITAPGGFEVSLSPDSNFSKNLSLPLAADSVRDTTVYVRADATAKIGNNTNSVTLSSSGITQKVGVSSTIYALPVVNNLSNIVVNKGDTVKAISFGGTGTSYDWTCDNPNIGLTNAGGANLPGFRAINNTNAPITANITVKPRFSLPGFIYSLNSLKGTMSLINANTNSLYKKIKNISSNYYSILENDSKKAFVLTSNYNYNSDSVSVIDLTTNKETSLFSSPRGDGAFNYYKTLAISPDAKTLYIGDDNYSSTSSNNISVYNLQNNSKVADINIDFHKPIYGFVISPDGKNLYVLMDTTYNGNTVKNDSYVLAVNTTTNQVTNTIPVGATGSAFLVSPDNSSIYVANYGSQYISVINANTNKEISEISVGQGYYYIVLSPDGTKLYTTNDVSNGSIMQVIDTKTNQIVANLPLGFNFPSNLSLSPDGKVIYVIDSDTYNVLVIDANTLKIITTIKNIFINGSAISFITSSNYYGTPSIFTITVNPTIPTINASAATGTITSCQGTPSTSPNTQQFTISGHFLLDNIAVNAPSGFEVSLSANSAFASSLTLPKTADSVTKTNVYVRSSGSAPVGNLSTIILVSSTGANSISIPVLAAISPLLNPAINITGSASNICFGTTVSFNASVTNGGTSPTYQWLLNGNNVGANSSNFSSNLLKDGDLITCMLKSNIACLAQPTVNSNSLIVKVDALPTVSAGGDKVIKKGLSTVLNASVTSDITDITWSPIEGLSNYKILNPIASPLTTTTYTITVLTSSGCSSSSSAKVFVETSISLPNVFTPNGDGINDTWNIKDIEGYPNCTVDIFNRYGTKVYSSRGYGIAWDGRYNNADLPVGTYYYIINLNDGSKIISGYVTLIR